MYEGSSDIKRSLLRWLYAPSLVAGMWKVPSDLMQFSGPLVLHALLGLVEEESLPAEERPPATGASNLVRGLTLVALLFISKVVASVALHGYFMRMYSLGMRSSNALCDAIFAKALRLSAASRAQYAGKV